MKYRILYDFRTSASFKEKSSDHFKDLHKLKLLTNFDVNLTNFDVNLTSSTGEVIHNVLIHNSYWR